MNDRRNESERFQEFRETDLGRAIDFHVRMRLPLPEPPPPPKYRAPYIDLALGAGMVLFGPWAWWLRYEAWGAWALLYGAGFVVGGLVSLRLSCRLIEARREACEKWERLGRCVREYNRSLNPE